MKNEIITFVFLNFDAKHFSISFMIQTLQQKILDIINEKYVIGTYGYEFIEHNQSLFIKISSGNSCSLVKIKNLNISEQTSTISGAEATETRLISKIYTCSDTAILTVVFDDNNEMKQNFYYQL